MPDTTEGNLQIVLQETGGNNNSWGTISNANLQKLVDAISEDESIVTTGGTTALSDDQQRPPFMRISGTLVSNATIEVNDSAKKWWFVHNNTTGSFTVTVTTDTGTGVVIPQGEYRVLFSDGTDVIEIAIFDRNDLFTGIYGGTVSGTDTYTATIAGFTDTAYAAGQLFLLTFSNTNTTDATLDINTIGAAAVLDTAGNQLPSGTVKGTHLIGHDGTNFVFLPTVGAVLAAGSVATAALADDAVTGAKIAAAVFGTGLGFDGSVASLDLSEVTEITTIALDDLFAGVNTSDSSATVMMSIVNMLKVLNLLTEDTDPDFDGDFALVFDTSANTVKKVTPENISGVKVEKYTPSNIASQEINLDIDNFDSFEIEFRGLEPATDGAGLNCRLRREGQASEDSGASDYAWTVDGTTASQPLRVGVANDDEIQLCPAGTGATSNSSGVFGKIMVHGANQARDTNISGTLSYKTQSIGHATTNVAARRQTYSKTNRIQIYFSTGNIAEGEIVIRSKKDP